MTDEGSKLVEQVREHFRARDGTADWQGLCEALDADAGRVHAALTSLIESGEVELASTEPPCNPAYRLAGG